MVGETTPASGTQSQGQSAGRGEAIVWWAMSIGFILVLVGLIDGLKMALKRHVITCPNGTYFPQGTTNFNCYAHPDAGTGTGIFVISALLGILVALSAVSAARALRND